MPSMPLAVFAFQSTLSVRRATYAPVTYAPRYGFQSTLSVRRATFRFANIPFAIVISIHALREESDLEHVFTARSRHSDFNPRSP